MPLHKKLVLDPLHRAAIIEIDEQIDKQNESIYRNGRAMIAVMLSSHEVLVIVLIVAVMVFIMSRRK